MTARAQPTPVTGSDIVALVMVELENYGADLDMYGQPTCDEIAAKIPLIAAAPDLLAFVERALDACFCDDGRGLPECARCVEARALLATVRGRP